MEGMEWVIRPPRYLPILMFPMLLANVFTLVVLTPAGWMFGTTCEAILWTVLPILGIGFALYLMIAKVVIDGSGVQVVAFLRWRFFRWEAIEAVETRMGTGFIPLAWSARVSLRVKGRHRPVKLWQVSRISEQNIERDAFIAELRRRFRSSRGEVYRTR